MALGKWLIFKETGSIIQIETGLNYYVSFDFSIKSYSIEELKTSSFYYTIATPQEAFEFLEAVYNKKVNAELKYLEDKKVSLINTQLKNLIKLNKDVVSNEQSDIESNNRFNKI